MLNVDKYVHIYREESAVQRNHIHHPADIFLLQRVIPHLNNISDQEVQFLWTEFSEQNHDCLWATLSQRNIAEFDVWLMD